jgi:hypothetical protein
MRRMHMRKEEGNGNFGVLKNWQAKSFKSTSPTFSKLLACYDVCASAAHLLKVNDVKPCRYPATRKGILSLIALFLEAGTHINYANEVCLVLSRREVSGRASCSLDNLIASSTIM